MALGIIHSGTGRLQLISIACLAAIGEKLGWSAAIMAAINACTQATGQQLQQVAGSLGAHLYNMPLLERQRDTRGKEQRCLPASLLPSLTKPHCFHISCPPQPRPLLCSVPCRLTPSSADL